MLDIELTILQEIVYNANNTNIKDKLIQKVFVKTAHKI